MTDQTAPPRPAEEARAVPLWRRMPAETLVFSSVGLVVLAVVMLGVPMPSPTVQIVLVGILGGVLGLPHGALDPLIARRAGLWRTPLGFARFNAIYILVVVAVVLIWLVAPVLSLVVFLLVTALHFGSDWNADRPAWLRFLSGFGLLTLPALSHPDQVSAIYVVLSGDGGAVVASVQEWLGPLAIAGLLLAALVALRHRPSQSVEIVIATALGLATEPLVFFVLYFCALHSFRHLKGGFQEERGNGRKTALLVVIYTVVPLLTAGILLFTFGPGGVLNDQMLQIVFIGLAALTMPHMMVVTYEIRQRRAGLAAVRRMPVDPLSSSTS